MSMRLLIVGGVAGGATAAARARRLDERAEIVLFERGEYISFANCGMPYYIGDIIPRRDDLLLTTPEDFRRRYNIDVRIMSEATAIDRERRVLHVRDHATGREYTEPYDKIILSPGAEPIRPSLPGLEDPEVFHLRNIPDMDRIKAFLDAGNRKRAVIVGGGFIGLEMAENLIHKGLKVGILEMQPQVIPPLDIEMAGLVHMYLAGKGIDLMLGEGFSGCSRGDHGLIVRTTKDRSVECDMVILSIGIRPENRLAREAGLNIGQRGGIIVNDRMQTSDPDIYAVGDAVEIIDRISGRPTQTALAGPANKQGRIAADNACGRTAVFRGTLGTAVVKLFDMTVASTGAGEKSLSARGLPYCMSYTHSGSNASYYPGADIMSVKLLHAPEDGRILGAQIVGGKGVDKRIDVIATAIHGGMTIFDLEELELAYAPPYSSAKDPINMAGFVAANIAKKDMEIIHWSDIPNLDREHEILLDLRQAVELRKVGKMEGAVHIPLHELRARLSELDRDKTYITVCAVGMRAYVAYRILVQHGFKAKVLSGGFATWRGSPNRVDG